MKMMTQSYFFNQIASESKKIYFSKLPFKQLKKLVNLNPKVALIATFKKKNEKMTMIIQKTTTAATGTTTKKTKTRN